MKPGPTYIRKCPQCSNHFSQDTLSSGNTFGAKFWTDGKMEALMMPNYPEYVGCPHCNKSLWVRETEIVYVDKSFIIENDNPMKRIERSKRYGFLLDSFSNVKDKLLTLFYKLLPEILMLKIIVRKHRKKYKNIPSSLPYIYPSIRICLSGLKEKSLKMEKEVYLRTRLMQLYNDKNRDKIKQANLSQSQINNLNKLLQLIALNSEEDKLFQVEIHRELRDFKEATKVLKSINNPENLDLINLMKKLIEKKDSRVLLC